MKTDGMIFVCVMAWAHGGARFMIEPGRRGGVLWATTFFRLIPGNLGICRGARIQIGSRIWGRRARPVIRSSLSRWTSTAPCGPVARKAGLLDLLCQTHLNDQDRVYS